MNAWIVSFLLLQILGLGLVVWPCLLAASRQNGPHFAPAKVLARNCAFRWRLVKASRLDGLRSWCGGVLVALWGLAAAAQTAQPDFDGPPDFGGPPPFLAGGPPGMGQSERKLVKRFDRNGDQRLNLEERKAARESLAQQPTLQRPGPPGGFGPRGANRGTPQPGRKVTLADVKSFPNAPLYDLKTLRTVFLEFENSDWEKELSDFHNTDVEVPATMIVDGEKYPDVGVRFRGASSYFMVGAGWKRSLNLSLDFVHPDQNLHGHRTLNLLNSNGDPTFMRPVLFLQIAQEYIAAPKANFVRVVINGEDWGLYVSVEQFNKDFVKERFGTTQGARWKVPGSPQGRGGLNYLGEDPAAYKRIYEIKSKDDRKSWAALIQLCKVLDTTPTNKLETALAPILDVDGVLKFLALENVFINEDGYWVRASDYSLYLDEQGRFHIIPHDANETFSMAEGPGAGGPAGGPRGLMPAGERPRFGPNSPGRFPPAGFDTNMPPRFARGSRGDGLKLDPLHGLNDSTKPLRSRLLAVPALRERYLGYVRELATKWLDWERLGPLTRQYHDLTVETVKADTRKLESTEAFEQGIEGVMAQSSGPGPGHQVVTLKDFATQRRQFLLPPAAK